MKKSVTILSVIFILVIAISAFAKNPEYLIEHQNKLSRVTLDQNNMFAIISGSEVRAYYGLKIMNNRTIFYLVHIESGRETKKEFFDIPASSGGMSIRTGSGRVNITKL